MATEVEIVNLALTLIGEPMITDLDENTKPARVGALWLSNARDAVLQSHPWNCAIKRESISATTTAPEYDFDYAFNLPSDCLRLLEVNDNPNEFEVESNQILCDDAGPLYVKYVYRLEDTQRFSALLTQAVVARLAYELNNALSRDPGRKKELWDAYLAKLSEARFVDATEGPDRRFKTDDWTGSRTGVEPFRPIPSDT